MSKKQIETTVKSLFAKYPINAEMTASEFIRFYWEKYTEEFQSVQSVNGGVFEQLLVVSLLREDISPVYVQAKLAFVPNVILDIVLYNRKVPVTISAKTSLRERWKQADLEAMATKYVHREAKCFVLTLSETEVRARRNEQNSYMGINRFVLAHTSEYDELINELKQIDFSESEQINIIETNDKLHNKDNIQNLYGIVL